MTVRPARILAIDHDTQSVDLVRRFFHEHFYTAPENIDFAESLAQADELIESKTYDLIIVEVSLRDGDGIEWAKALANGKDQLPALICTSSIRDEDMIIRARAAGIHRFLEKPLLIRQFGQFLDGTGLMSSQIMVVRDV